MQMRWIAVFLLGVLLSACAHVTNDGMRLCSDPAGLSATCSFDPTGGYRFDPDKPGNAERKTLIFLTFSGGGIRAASLAYGTLLALRDIPVAKPPADNPPPGSSLLDNVDVISSVSGGSVTAGWYALMGREGLVANNKLQKFLFDSNSLQIALWGLNPLQAAGYVFSPDQRSDVLARYFSRKLFAENDRQATYFDVLRKYRSDPFQPYTILNATDFGHETRFSFTQGQFDLICSEITKYPLAYGVAASANFPIVFSPIGIQNFSADCPVHSKTNWQTLGPPVWIKERVPPVAQTPVPADAGCFPPGSRTTNGPSSVNRSNALLELRAARAAAAYAYPCPGDRVIHLLDGGLVDNLGVSSILELYDKPGLSPGLYQRILPAAPRLPLAAGAVNYPGRYNQVRDIIFIVVNARTRTVPDIDRFVYPPGLTDSLLRVIDTPLDATILDTQNYLTAELEATVNNANRFCPGDARQQPDCVHEHIVTVDFEDIPQGDCRARFWQLPTDWSLKDKTIQALIDLPRYLLRESPDLQDYLGQGLTQLSGLKDANLVKICSDVAADYPEIDQ